MKPKKEPNKFRSKVNRVASAPGEILGVEAGTSDGEFKKVSAKSRAVIKKQSRIHKEALERLLHR